MFKWSSHLEGQNAYRHKDSEGETHEVSRERKNSTGNWNKSILAKTLYSTHDVLKIQMMLTPKVMNEFDEGIFKIA